VAHSVGTMLTLEALRQFYGDRGEAAAERIGAVIFASPDIDIDVFKSSVARIGPLAAKITLITSTNDRALAVSRWIAGGVMSEQWLPASPVTGKLDAFVWQRPDERPSSGGEPEEAIFRPIAAPAEPTLLIEKTQTIAIAPPGPENQAGPDPALATAASRAITGEGATAEASSGEDNEQGPAVAAAPSVAANDPVPEPIPRPGWLRPLFRAVAVGRKAAADKGWRY